MSGTPTTSLRTVLSHVLLPILMGAIMATVYLGGFHKPDPHGLPLAVVGQAAVAGPVAATIQQAVGEKAAVTSIPTEAQAIDDIKNLRISGALVPGSNSDTLLTSTAASDTSASVAEKIFRTVAQKQGVTLQVNDVVPVTGDDPAGQNSFFYLVALTVGSYATSIAIGATTASRRFRDRVAIGAGAAVVMSTGYLVIAAAGFHMFAGHVMAAWGFSLLYSTTVLAIGIGLHAVLGRFSTIVYSSIFVAINFTSSGGVFAPQLQPGVYGWLHDFWIGSGFVEGLRRVVYFPEASLAGPMGILIGWFLFGVLCLAIAFEVGRRRNAALVPPTQDRAQHRHMQYSQHRPENRKQLKELTPLDEEVEEELEENVAV
ncbi:MAG: hypothetical protein HIU81_02450 [Acidobacteria bacterium]|nr:hypothetical protein [Acidobacteriota bacterium]